MQQQGDIDGLQGTCEVATLLSELAGQVPARCEPRIAFVQILAGAGCFDQLSVINKVYGFRQDELGLCIWIAIHLDIMTQFSIYFLLMYAVDVTEISEVYSCNVRLASGYTKPNMWFAMASGIILAVNT